MQVDNRVLTAERLGGADYDGDMVKTIASPIVNQCVRKNYFEYSKSFGNMDNTPLLMIPGIEPLIRDANDWRVRFETVKNTFSSRVGQISNAALNRSIIACNENSTAEERERYRQEVEALTILTGLEIDSAKSGVKPDLSKYLGAKDIKRSRFLRLNDIMDDAEKGWKWYEPTRAERLKAYHEKTDWSRADSNLEKLPYLAYQLEKYTPKLKPRKNKPADLYTFAEPGKQNGIRLYYGEGWRVSKRKHMVADCIFTVVILSGVFGLNLLLQNRFQTQTMTPMIFVLGVFLVSWQTQGHLWGIAASLISVLAVNWAFTYPYWAFDLISPECISSAVVMLIVATMTSALTTRLKQQEKLKADAEKERMRGNLLRAVSHDLRTPLTSIYGACSAMIENYDELPREKQLKLLSDVRGDAQWLNRMVENLLSVTRVDADKVRLSKNSTVLEELIDAMLVKFRKRCPGQAVETVLPEDVITVPMDPMLMEQVLVNLLENAVYHAHGMTWLRLEVFVRGGRAHFIVSDNGCGIPPDRIRDLFTGYLDRTEQPVDGGRSNMGIGLSVCASIIKAHGGEIQAGNRPEGGAVFEFSLEMEDNRDE